MLYLWSVLFISEKLCFVSLPVLYIFLFRLLAHSLNMSPKHHCSFLSYTFHILVGWVTSPLLENKYLTPQNSVDTTFSPFRNFKDLWILPTVYLRVSYDSYESNDRVSIRSKQPRVRSLWGGHWFLLYDVDKNRSSIVWPCLKERFLA